MNAFVRGRVHKLRSPLLEEERVIISRTLGDLACHYTENYPAATTYDPFDETDLSAS